MHSLRRYRCVCTGLALGTAALFLAREAAAGSPDMETRLMQSDRATAACCVAALTSYEYASLRPSEDHHCVTSGSSVISERESAPASGASRRGGTCRGLSAVLQPSATSALPESDRAALDRAYERERFSNAVYGAILERFGDVRPYVNVARAEGRHVATLKDVYNRYGIEPPAERTMEVPNFGSLEESLAWAAAFEEANAKEYERYRKATDNADLIRVFGTLAGASRNHIPTFERALARR